MKKLLLLLVTFIAGITAYGQDEGKIKLTLNVDNPERVSIAIFGEPLEGLKRATTNWRLTRGQTSKSVRQKAAR